MDEQWLRLFEEMLYGYSSEFKSLFEMYGGDLNLQNKEDSSLLHEAVCCRSEAIVKMLLEKEDVDVNIRDKRGRSPLWVAASRSYKNIVKLLLEHDRVDPEARDENDQTPLSAAVMQPGGGLMSGGARAQESVVEALLASGKVDPEAKDASGLTPLAWASRARNGSVKISELLLNSSEIIKGLRPERGSSDVDSRFITHWIESCDAQHGSQCKPAPLEQKSPQQLPHWVIDVGRACLVPGDSVPRYVALSYVWSQGLSNDTNAKRPTDSILLEKLNLPSFQIPKYLKEVWTRLPTAVKDAILLVHRLGENYLWVDCLCIVQDDESTRDQVDHIGDIYSSAHFTIIATTYMGELSGFRHGASRDKGFHNETVEGLYGQLYSSTWATRGWTFQEQMLSKRAIVFSDHSMFWECQQNVWSQYGPRPEMTAAGSAFFTVPHYEKASRMLSSCYPDFDLYTEMISLYNSRTFTYPQDVLPAFSGILATLGRNFPSGFQYGLPRVHLDIALLWQPFRQATRRIRRDQDTGIIAPKTHIPSWSWCGWICSIDPFHLRTRSSYFDYNNRASQMPVWRTQKLVRWYCLPEDMHCQVLVEEPWILPDGASMIIKDDKFPNTSPRHSSDNCRPTKRVAETVYSAVRKTAPSPPLSTTPRIANPKYVSQPHDVWPFLSCQTSCVRFYIKAVHHSVPASRLPSKFRSIFTLPQFAEGPTVADTCDLVCLGTQEGLTAGTLRHMEESKLKLGNTVELIAVSTGTVNSTGVEGDEEDKLYRLVMEAPVGSGPVHAETSEYLEVKKEMELYGVEGPDGREYHFYNVLWVERKEGIAYRRAAGRVPKAIWDANCTPLTKIILG